MPLPAAWIFAVVSAVQSQSPPPAPYPMMEYKAGYLEGQALACEISPDNTRAFVAEGAVIAVVDLTVSTPPYHVPPAIPTSVPSSAPYGVIQRIDIPHSTTNSLLLYRHPDADATSASWLFIAGGTLGLARISICPSLLASPPSVCANTDYMVMDTAGSIPPAPGQFKRCVDLTIVEKPAVAADPQHGIAYQAPRHLLLALYASSNAANIVPGHTNPSEVRAYELFASGGFSLYGRCILSGVTASAGSIVATAIESDPGDPKHVYLAMGLGWLWSLDVSQVNTNGEFVQPQPIPVPSSIPPCSLSPTCMYGESMRDISVVRTSPGGIIFIHAMLDYGRLLEFEDVQYSPTQGTATVAAVREVAHCNGFGRKVDSVADTVGGIMIAASTGGEPAILAATHAPDSPTAVWGNICLGVGLPDPNVPSGGGMSNTQMHIFRHSTNFQTMEVSAPTTFDSEIDYSYSVIIRRIATDARYRIFGVSSVSGLLVTKATRGASESVFALTPYADYAGYVTDPAGGIVSSDGTVLYMGHDGLGSYPTEGYQYRIASATATVPLSIRPVPETTRLCPGSSLLPVTGVCPPGDATGDPCPFLGSITGGAHWNDAGGVSEWYLRGGDTWLRSNANCEDSYMVPQDVTLAECDTTALPCNTLKPWKRKAIQLKPGVASPHHTGISVVNLSTHSPSTGASENMKWYQFAVPTVQSTSRSVDTDYIWSANDPRMDPYTPSPGPTQQYYPRYVHASRSFSYDGYKVFRTSDILAFASATCGGGSPGIGENIVAGTCGSGTGQLPFVEAMTHVELGRFTISPAPSQECALIATCNSGAGQGAVSSKRNLFSNQSVTFSVVDGQNVIHYITAVAAGFIATGNSVFTLVQTTGCPWLPYYGKANLLLFDADDPFAVSLLDTTGVIPSSAVPVPCTQPVNNVQPFYRGTPLLRIALSSGEGHAFAVQARTYGTGPLAHTYAFVADAGGKFLTYDVSWQNLFHPAGVPYISANGPNPFLSPIPVNGELAFPLDLCEGVPPNCVDVKLDGDYAYCALGRAGLGIVDISDPTHPSIVEVVDTPGLAEGLLLRTDSMGHHQLIVADSRCGIRIYGIPGQ